MASGERGPFSPPLRLGAVIHAVDAHAAGEPGRVIVGGVDGIPSGTMFEAMSWLQANRDDVRLRMLREPRGYQAANCNLILPSSHLEADAGYVIMEQVEYPGMSGTNTMCVVTVLLETGMLPMTEPLTELTLESPAGLIRVTAECADGKVRSVTFRNVPAFTTHLDAAVEVPHEERVLYPDDLRAAHEMFITSSLREIVPVVTLDGVHIGSGAPGAVTRALLEAYRGGISRSSP